MARTTAPKPTAANDALIVEKFNAEEAVYIAGEYLAKSALNEYIDAAVANGRIKTSFDADGYLVLEAA